MTRKRTLKEKLAVLTETASAMMTELEPSVLLDFILDRVQSLFGVDRCAVLQVERGKRVLKLVRSVGYNPDIAAGFSIEVGKGISGWVASTGLPAFIEDVASDPRYVPGVTGAVSEVAVPLRRKEEVVGVLDIESTKRLSLNDFDMELLMLFASQCAAALYTASLVSELEEHKKQLETRLREQQVLNHIGKLLGEVLPLDEVLREILRLARDVLNFKACAILLPEGEDRDVLRVRAAIGYPPSIIEKIRIRKGEGITGLVYRTGIPRLVEDVRKVSDYIPGVVGGRCEMACPLVVRGRVLGVLDAEGETPGCFTEHQFVLFSTFASQAAVAIRNAALLERSQAVYYETISTLANALEARDRYTRGHSERVTKLAVQIGERLGLSKDELNIVRQAGMLHDIGKIGITDEILNKPAELTKKEREEIEHHPMFGSKILEQLKFLRNACHAILHHHERYDGNGYPGGLVGSDIPIVARVIAVADAWDAMTSDRPYRKAMDERQAIREIQANAGKQFDPEVVRAFLSVLGYDEHGA